MIVAYLRGTVDKQHWEKQKSIINRYVAERGVSIDKWVTDVIDREKKDNEITLYHVLERMGKGDEIIITDISRFGRTLSEVMLLLSTCMKKGVCVCSINERYILNDDLDMEAIAKGCLLVTDIEHSLMSIRTKEALNYKKSKEGIRLGRPKGTNAKQSVLEANREEVISMLESGQTVDMICQHFNVSRNTYYQFKRNYKL